jgi:hypothetical protein
MDAAQHSAPHAPTQQATQSFPALSPAPDNSPNRRATIYHATTSTPALPLAAPLVHKAHQLFGKRDEFSIHDQCSSMEGSSFHPSLLLNHPIRQLCVAPAR